MPRKNRSLKRQSKVIRKAHYGVKRIQEEADTIRSEFLRWMKAQPLKDRISFAWDIVTRGK